MPPPPSEILKNTLCIENVIACSVGIPLDIANRAPEYTRILQNTLKICTKIENQIYPIWHRYLLKDATESPSYQQKCFVEKIPTITFQRTQISIDSTQYLKNHS